MIPHLWSRFLTGCFSFSVILCPSLLQADQATKPLAYPVVNDDLLQLELIASEPQIVTPIGLAIDSKNRLFVVESHTHHRPANYQGPGTDVIKLFVDGNDDGIPDTPKVFASGFQSAMNLAFSPSGELYLVHRNGVMILHDKDDDGQCEKTTTVVEVVTRETYPHNGLSGIVFSRDGWLYLGMGENFGVRYILRGSDGKELETQPGRGGKIFRCRPDGSELQEVAAGFWNPFGLEMDRANRLFCVDNDPGGRPPCRLLHIVQGGDYGYKRRYDDNNAFNGWNGELPGTLPMLSGVGESPCGILVTDRLSYLSDKYPGALLVASWGDAAVEMYQLQPNGASFKATQQILIAGERKFQEAFCPVTLAAAPDGSLYLTDWADRTSYPVHGKGRIWRLSVKKGFNVAPATYSEPLVETNLELLRFARLLNEKLAIDDVKADWRKALKTEDPFLQSAVIAALARSDPSQVREMSLRDDDPSVRLAALVALWRSGGKQGSDFLKQALQDDNERIRLLALWWIGEEGLVEYKDDLVMAVAQNPSPTLFEAYLTSAELLEVASNAENTKNPDALMGATKPAVRQQILSRLLLDDSQPATLHAMAAAMVGNLGDDKIAARLLHFAQHGSDEILRREAVRTLGSCPAPEVPEALLKLILDATLPSGLRADAILSLARRDPGQLGGLIPLVDDPSVEIQLEAVRALRLSIHVPEVKEKFQAKLSQLEGVDPDASLTQQLRMALQTEGGTRRPSTVEEWKTALSEPGDAVSGERVFLNSMTNCTMCHQARGRGNQIGPNLSYVARSLDRDRLIEAILDPSREVAPQYEHHLVTTKDGKAYSGVLIHSNLDGAPLMDALGVGRVRIPIAQIERHVTSPQSMMPAGLENTMTVADFRDLITYLLSLK